MNPQAILVFVIDALAVLFALIITVDFVVGLRALWVQSLPNVSVSAVEPLAKAEPSDCHVGAIATAKQVEPPIAIPDLAASPVVLEVTNQPDRDYFGMTPEALRKLCSHRGITWRNAHGLHKHLRKSEMVLALLASDEEELAIEPPHNWGHLPATA